MYVQAGLRSDRVKVEIEWEIPINVSRSRTTGCRIACIPNLCLTRERLPKRYHCGSKETSGARRYASWNQKLRQAKSCHQEVDAAAGPTILVYDVSRVAKRRRAQTPDKLFRSINGGIPHGARITGASVTDDKDIKSVCTRAAMPFKWQRQVEALPQVSPPAALCPVDCK